MSRIRIKDIAQMADVSVGTVDRVLHGRSGVSEASRKRVEEILKQLDYQPNMYASALASNKQYTYACLLPQHEAANTGPTSKQASAKPPLPTRTSTSRPTLPTTTLMTITRSNRLRNRL